MIKKLFFLETWTLAFTEEYKDIKSLINYKWQVMKPNIFDYFADPSILSINTEAKTVEIVCESINFLSGKGYIKKLTYSFKDKKIINSDTLIKNKFHLSFPNKFHFDGEEILIYENQEQNYLGVLNLNNLNIDNNQIVTGKYLDPIVIKVKDDNLLIYSYRSNHNIEFGIKHIGEDFELKETDVKYIHNTRSTRNAGKIIFEDNSIYRPGQIGDKRYGEGIVFNKLYLTEHGVEEKEFCAFKSDEIFENSTGLHTISIKNNICILDVRIQKFNPLAFVIKIIRRIRKYVKQ